MKKICLIILLCGIYTLGFAQTNDIVVYSEKGEEFTVFVNGVKQNDPPAPNVRARNITGTSYQVRVQFVNPAIPELTQRLYTEEKNVDITLAVKQNNKGKWSLAYRGETPRVAEVQQTTPAHHHRNNLPAQNSTINMNVNDGRESVNMNMTITENSMSIQAGAGQESVNINMNMNMGGNVSTNVTTTTTTSSSHGNSYHQSHPGQTYGNNTKCTYPMSASDFSDAKNSIQSKTFSDTKMTLAKQISKGSCLSSEQVREIMKLFTMDNDRLEFAKYAYDFVFDSNKYYMVNDAFSYSSSVNELHKYLEGR